MINEIRESAVLANEAGPIAMESKFLGHRVEISNQTLVGWAANNNNAKKMLSNPESLQSWPLLSQTTLSEAAIPIRANSEVYGVLYLQSAKENAFEDDTLSALQTLGDQLAIGIQKIRLLESTEIDLEETSTLYRTSLKITQTNQKADLIATLQEGLKNLALFSSIYVIEEDGGIRSLGINTPNNPSNSVITQSGVSHLNNIKEQFLENSLIILEDISESTEFSQILAGFIQEGCSSAALLGIKEAGELAVIIVLAYQNQKIPTATRLQPFVNLVHVTSNVLDRLQITQHLETRLNELQTMSSVSIAISNETDLNHLYQILHDLISALIGRDLVFSIALFDKDNEKIDIPFLYENETISTLESMSLGEGLTSHILQTREPLLLNQNVEQEAHRLGAKIFGSPPKSWLGVPLMVTGEAIGAVILQDTVNEHRFDDHDLNLLNTLASQIGAAIQNAQLIAGLKKALQEYDQERFLLNTLLGNVPDQIYFKDKEGKFLRVSESYASQFNLRPEELIGRSDFDLMEEELSYQIAEEELTLLQNGRKRLETVSKKRSAEGNETWYQTSKIPLLGNDAQPFGLFSISRDITDLKLTEETATLRAKQLQTAAEIARDTTGTLDINEFLAEAVNLVRDRFGFYHASIFLMDSIGQNAILRESTGEAGEQLKRTHHKLAVGSQSLVGQATKTKAPVIINDVGNDPNYYPNPFLPDTLSELVLPLIVRDELLGVLDVQSTEINAFLPEDLEILQIVADQLAAAILSANLYSDTQKNFNLQRALQNITIETAASGTLEELLHAAVEGLHSILPDTKISFYTLSRLNKLELQASSGYEGNNIIQATIDFSEGIIGASASQRTPILIKDTVTEQRHRTINENTRSDLAIPIIYKDQLFGILNFESDSVAAFNDNDKEIFTVWSNNIGAALSNLQLMSQIRSQVNKQRTINQISSSIHSSVDIGLILETSATEICKALGAKRASITINPEPNFEKDKNNGSNGPQKMEEIE